MCEETIYPICCVFQLVHLKCCSHLSLFRLSTSLETNHTMTNWSGTRCSPRESFSAPPISQLLAVNTPGRIKTEISNKAKHLITQVDSEVHGALGRCFRKVNYNGDSVMTTYKGFLFLGVNKQTHLWCWRTPRMGDNGFIDQLLFAPDTSLPHAS